MELIQRREADKLLDQSLIMAGKCKEEVKIFVECIFA